MSSKPPSHSSSSGRKDRRTTRSQGWKPPKSQNVKGRVLRLNTNPPVVNYQPWNFVTLVKFFKGTESIKTQDILALLRSQVDPHKRGFNQTTSGDGRFVVQFKLKSVRAWNLTGKILALSVDDFNEQETAKGERDQLCGVIDTGTATHTPAVGYILPKNLQEKVIRTDDKQGDDYLFTGQVGDSDQGIFYITIEYRFDGPIVLPKYFTPLDYMNSGFTTVAQGLDSQITATSSLSKRTSDMKKILSRLKEISENTYASRPSIIKKVITGIGEVALMTVLSAAAADDDASSFGDFAELNAVLDEVTNSELRGQEADDLQ